MSRTIGFGEIMGRLNMPQHQRFVQGLPGNLEVTFAGAEANVCAEISMLGQDSSFVTALPEHEVADASVMVLRRLGVDVSSIIRVPEGRLGTYYVENGANHRSGKVIYDRDFSSVSLTATTAYNWEKIFEGGTWFHISGITPALSKTAAEVSIEACKTAKESGLTVSCDLNFRNKLWNWDNNLSKKELARKTMTAILPYVDVLIGNEEDAESILGIKAGESNVLAGELEIDKYPEVAKEITRMFPNISKVAITLRESISATHNNWGAMLYDAKKGNANFAPKDGTGNYKPYEIRNIVDRVGGGDSFSGSLIFALQDEKLKDHDQELLNFSVAASCLCHSITGDFNFVSRSEVESLASGDKSGRVKR